MPLQVKKAKPKSKSEPQIPEAVKQAWEALYASDHKRFTNWKTYAGIAACLEIVKKWIDSL